MSGGGLGLYARFGWRNLGRNRRRTAVTGLAIVLGVGLCIGTYGITDGMDADLIGSVTRAELGEVQIHHPGYLARRSLDLSIPDGQALARKAEAWPDVRAAAPRAYAWALCSHGDRSIGVQLMGVDPTAERRVTTLTDQITEGRALPPGPTPWPAAAQLSGAQQALDEQLTAEATAAAIAEIEGTGGAPAKGLRARTEALVERLAPRPAEAPPALIGDRLAARLRARIGEEIVVLGQGADGNGIDQALRVVGVFHTGNDAVDRSRVVVHLTDLQRLLRRDGLVHELALRVVGRDARPVARALAAQPAFAGLSVEPWQTLRPDLLAMIAANDALTGLIILVVVLIAALGVVNTMLMAVSDRRRELGVLRALGMQPGALVAMMMLETSLLATIAAGLGVVLGVALDLYLIHHGLAVRFIGRFSIAGVGLEPVLHAAITRRGVALPAIAMVTMAALGALIPAIAAARVQPAVGMRDA